MSEQEKRRFRAGREVEERYRFRVPGFENAKEVYRFDEPDDAASSSGSFCDPAGAAPPPWSEEWQGGDGEESAREETAREETVRSGDAGQSGKRHFHTGTASFEELLADVDQETGSEKYGEADDVEVSQEEVDELVRDELAKRGFLGMRMRRVLGAGPEPEDIYLDRDLVSENDPLIASIEEEVRRRTEEEARESLKLSKREEKARLAAERKAEAERKAAEKAAEKRGAESQIEAERRMIAEIREAEAAARRKEEKRLARKKRRAIRAEKRRKRRRGVLGFLLRIPVIVIVVLLSLALLAVTMSFLGRSELRNTKITTMSLRAPGEEEPEEGNADEVRWDGALYRRIRSRTNILFLGLDPGAEKERMIDSLFLLSYDTSAGTSSFIGISADTETGIDFYNAEGEYLLMKKAPLSLAYAAGGGGERGCRNAAEAVSGLLFGIPVNAFFALDLRAAGGLADAVGGVEAVVTEDLGERYIEGYPGDLVNLRGDAAESYLRSYVYTDPAAYETAEESGNRLERQVSFLTGFLRRVKRDVRVNPLFPFYLMRYLSGRSFTSLSLTRELYLVSALASGRAGRELELTMLPGRAKESKDGIRYAVDETAAWEILLGIFFERAD